jgi:hypothetical protein
VPMKSAAEDQDDMFLQNGGWLSKNCPLLYILNPVFTRLIGYLWELRSVTEDATNSTYSHLYFPSLMQRSLHFGRKNSMEETAWET